MGAARYCEKPSTCIRFGRLQRSVRVAPTLSKSYSPGTISSGASITGERKRLLIPDKGFSKLDALGVLHVIDAL